MCGQLVQCTVTLQPVHRVHCWDTCKVNVYNCACGVLRDAICWHSILCACGTCIEE